MRRFMRTTRAVNTEIEIAEIKIKFSSKCRSEKLSVIPFRVIAAIATHIRAVSFFMSRNLSFKFKTTWASLEGPALCAITAAVLRTVRALLQFRRQAIRCVHPGSCARPPPILRSRPERAHPQLHPSLRRPKRRQQQILLHLRRLRLHRRRIARQRLPQLPRRSDQRHR